MHRAHRILLTATAAAVTAAALTACTEAPPAAPSTTTPPATTTVAAAAPSTTTSTTTTTTTPPVQLTKVSADWYTGQAFGTHFTDSTGTIACNFAPAKGGCVFTGKQFRLPDTAATCAGTDAATPFTAVGWTTRDDLATAEPSQCRVAAAWFGSPALLTAADKFKDAELPRNSTITITLDLNDPANRITCNTTTDEFRCVQQKSGHGFTATAQGLQVF